LGVSISPNAEVDYDEHRGAPFSWLKRPFFHFSCHFFLIVTLLWLLSIDDEPLTLTLLYQKHKCPEQKPVGIASYFIRWLFSPKFPDMVSLPGDEHLCLIRLKSQALPRTFFAPPSLPVSDQSPLLSHSGNPSFPYLEHLNWGGIATLEDGCALVSPPPQLNVWSSCLVLFTREDADPFICFNALRFPNSSKRNHSKKPPTRTPSQGR